MPSESLTVFISRNSCDSVTPWSTWMFFRVCSTRLSSAVCAASGAAAHAIDADSSSVHRRQQETVTRELLSAQAPGARPDRLAYGWPGRCAPDLHVWPT